ncbi:MAG: hypothetical protein LBT00_01010 [Spirochaetaceae bacterium]|nr:hypothetical protein [Spirochaetaceae bacterium]
MQTRPSLRACRSVERSEAIQGIYLLWIASLTARSRRLAMTPALEPVQ